MWVEDSARCAGNFVDSDRSTWVATLDVNLTAVLVGAQLAARVMKPGDNGEDCRNCSVGSAFFKLAGDACHLCSRACAYPTKAGLCSMCLNKHICTRVLAGIILLMASAGGLFPMFLF